MTARRPEIRRGGSNGKKAAASRGKVKDLRVQKKAAAKVKAGRPKGNKRDG